MKNAYRKFKRGNVFYVQNNSTGKQESLHTSDDAEAEKLLYAKNQAESGPMLNLAIGLAHLKLIDPKFGTRTWQFVMEEYCSRGRQSTRERRQRQLKSSHFNLIRNKLIIETISADFYLILKSGKPSVNHTLRLLHSFALGYGWLPTPVIPSKLWPKLQTKPKRGVTLAEHQKIIESEKNLERRLYYELLWEVGAAQTDGASLTAENINWRNRTLTYHRQKLQHDQKPAILTIGAKLESILRQLPNEGPLFPTIVLKKDTDRAAEFYRRCKLLGITGVSLHSYRYAWAERAMTCGYPERYAQAALGHSSAAVHHAYAKGGIVNCPSLEDYQSSAEEKIIYLNKSRELDGKAVCQGEGAKP